MLADATRIRADLASGKARQARIDAGVSGAEVARELQRRGHGVTPQAVFYWETGVNTPTVEHALAYGRVLAALTRRAALARRRCSLRQPSRKPGR